MSQSKGHIERDCTEKCKSTQHGDQLCSVISKRGVSDAELCSYVKWKCSACGQIFDSVGRTALHLAASCGRTQFVKWLVQNRGAQINAKDLESGYTALHRSVFYGKINTTVLLIQLGANINALDHNDLTPLEHAMKDRRREEFTVQQSCQAYVWGTNINYTLGIGSQHAKQLPDLHDVFHKKYTDVSLKQICLDKFHCVMLSQNGQVFSCGHGQGGRLGINSESTVLIAQELQFRTTGTPFVCSQIAIGRDHSLFLSETGQVWSCGLNTYHVLGVKPPPAQLLVPKQLNDLRHELKGICAGRFHSVAWGPLAIYTWGLHAGHLGHVKSPNSTYLTPKLVANFLNEDTEIVSVAASDGATVVSTKKGDVFVFHEYQCRRIASRQLNIEKVIVVGGHLNSKLSGNLLVERGGKELKVLVLLTTGNILLWQESWPQLSRCIYTLNRPLIVRDAVLSRTELFFITDDGEAFRGEFRTRKKKMQETAAAGSGQKSAFHEFLDKDECQIVKVTKFSHIHRAVKIQCDPKGRNFAVLQNDPKNLLTDVPEISPSIIVEEILNLLNNSDEMDAIHDVTFKVSGYIFAVHRYIIASKSEPLNALIESNLHGNTIELSNINPQIFKQILLYIYTNTCDILKGGVCPKELQKLCGNIKQNDHTEIDNNMSAFNYYNNNKTPKSKQKNKDIKEADDSQNPLNFFRQAAKRFGIKQLIKQLEHYSYSNGNISIKNHKKESSKPLMFDRQVLPEFQDVIIKSKSGATISAHKCILASRLEYFNNLFAIRWNENSQQSIISLPISYSVLQQIIDYLYTDEAPDLLNSNDIDHISNVLIVSDQLFIERLKEICEVALSHLLTLRNASQMLQFASIYNANQLKRCSMDFICLNLSAILETKILEYVEPDVLDELTEYYCSWNPLLSKRVITPYSDAPCDEIVKTIYEQFPVKIEVCDENFEKKTPTKIGGRRKIRTRRSSNNKTQSESNNSFSETFEEENNENKVEKKQSTDEKWITILAEKQKHQKIVQARLQAIINSKDAIESNKEEEENFTKLIASSSPKSIPKATNLSFSEQYSSPPLSPIYDIPIQKAQKLSQKQRKKLAAESLPTNEPEKSKPCWSNLVSSKKQNSFADIIKGETKGEKDINIFESPSQSPRNPWQKIEVALPKSSPEMGQKFLDIVADEKKQKDNWTKMRTRPLIYTQMEDKAIRELERFYNVDEVFDENITIHKVEKGAFSVPLWAHSNTKH